MDDPAVDVRESMRRLPSVLQLPLTYLTGKPYTDQQGPKLTPTFHLATALGSLAIGLTCSAAAWPGPNLLLLVLGWAITLHGMRNLRMRIFHQAAHRTYAFLVPSTVQGVSESQVDNLRRNQIEPALRKGDWSGAAVAPADGLSA